MYYVYINIYFILTVYWIIIFWKTFIIEYFKCFTFEIVFLLMDVADIIFIDYCTGAIWLIKGSKLFFIKIKEKRKESKYILSYEENVIPVTNIWCKVCL